MRSHPLLAVAAASALALLAASAVAAPAAASAPPTSAVAARALPSGDSLSALSCDWSRSDDRLELLALDPASGSGPSLGSNGPGELYFCAYSVAWDRQALSCLAYSVARGPDDPPALLRTDLDAGTSSLVAPITLDGKRVWAGSFAIDASGAGWEIYNNDLYRVDLTTGVLSSPLALSGPYLGALAFNPADGALYGSDRRTIYRIDLSTGALIPWLTPDLRHDGLDSPYLDGLTFDSSGTAWIAALTAASAGQDVFHAEYELWSASPSAAPELAGIISSATEGAAVDAFALATVPPAACDLPTQPLPAVTPAAVPTLAATGLEDATPALVPVALVALALGAVLLSFARRARRAGAHRRG